MSNPSAIYELDDNGEATGVVHWYCSHGHAEADFEGGAYDGERVTSPEGIEIDEYPDGTVCERCMTLLPMYGETA